MKKIYTIGTKQSFTYAVLKFFNKIIKTEEHWVVRNVKYIYANNEEEAVEKYKKWFFYMPKRITHGWGDWYMESEGANVMMNENRVNITSTQIVFIDEENIDINFETLRKHMQAENFKEWWFDWQDCHTMN